MSEIMVCLGSSISETLSHSYVALDQSYIDENGLEQIKTQAEIVWKKVNNLITYLNKSANKSVKRTNKTNRTNRTKKTNKPIN